jgi:hypothetical protein
VGKIFYLQSISICSAIFIGVVLPLRTAGINVSPQIELALAVTILACALLNIYIKFGQSQKTLKNFLRTPSPGLLLDFVCLVPIGTFTSVFGEPSIAVILFFQLCSVRYIWLVRSIMDEFPMTPPVVYRLVPLALMMPLLVHIIACGWMALGSGSSGPDPDKSFEYVKAIYWAFTTLSTVGYGDITPKTAIQMMYAAGTQFIGVGVFGFVLSNVASLLGRMDAAREHHMENFDRMETFMSSHRIPQNIKSSVRGYYHYLWKNHKGYSDWAVIRTLPPKVQSDLLYCINESIVEKVPLFKGASKALLEDLMHELRPKIAVPNESVFRWGEPGTAMYFIQNGEIEILNFEGEKIVTLKEGAFFGEMALINDRLRAASALAVSYCDLYVLSKDSFNRVLQTFPEFRKHVEETIAQRSS